MKKIPYGIADYKMLVEENYYFVDKTHYIPKLEEIGRYLIFLRPRRFGKSLLISYLAYYYDIFYKNYGLYKDTYIGKNPTKEAHSYYVLRFNFSSVSIEDVEYFFKHNIATELQFFIDKYNLNIKIESHPKATFENILSYMKKNNLKLYILIDEYDHFANRLLIQNENDYKNIITDKTAFFKEFFTILKSATDSENSPLKRLFITGVTPMTMFDVTSGFNIGQNISLKEEFNGLVGFNEEELKKLLEYYKIDVDIDILREWYNNYQFNKHNQEKIFNSDAIFYFLNNSKNRLPDEMIDINLRSDYKKLRYLIYTNKKLNGNFETLQKLVSSQKISITNIIQDFSALKLSEENNFKSLLFYLGLVTIENSFLKLNLKIPNETIKRIDAEYIAVSLKYEDMLNINISKLEDYFADFALNGDIQVFEFLAKEIEKNTSIRDYIKNELVIKSFYITYFSLVPYYITKTELELNKGFTDLFVKPFYKEVKYFALVELKYIPRTEKLSNEKIDKLKKEAITQLNKYENDELVEKYTKQNKILKKIVLVFYGWELVVCEEVK